MFVGKEMTDSASILSVGSNGFEIVFDRFAGRGLEGVGVASVGSLVGSSISAASLSGGSGSGSSAAARQAWEIANSAATNAVDAIARSARVTE
ncbi:MAG: hypothetical protein JRF15_09230 [Deltaproteobacteria bacterium]|jgi:hypothetical protein|nr:hypothetical protein [Deltaproteobacteria bacterium]